MAHSVRQRVNGVVIAVVLGAALPLIAVVEKVRQGGGRRLAQGTVRLVGRLCGIRITVTGADRLDPDGAYVFVPNHTSPADIAALLIARGDVRFVAAAELMRIPLLGSAMRALGTVPIDRRRPIEARRRLRELATEGGGSVVVFAEGGIPGAGEIRRFKTGAFALAIDASMPVVPVTIRGSDAVLPRGRRIGARPGHITVELHKPINTVGLTRADRNRLRDRTELAVRGAVVGIGRIAAGRDLGGRAANIKGLGATAL